MAYVPNSGSVAAWLQSDNASVITVPQGSVATVIIGGSIAASFTPPANQSVSGIVGASVIGYPGVNVGGSVMAFQGAGWSGSVAAIVSNFPTTQNVSGSVVATQGTTPWAVSAGGSVITVFQDSSIISINKSSSTIAVVTGSVVSIPVGSTISYIQNSVATVIIGGSVAAGTQYLENQIIPSVTGTAVMFKSNISSSIMSVVTPQNPLPVSVQGVVTALQGGAPWANTNVGSIITKFQDSSLISVPTGNQSVSGTVNLGLGATLIGSVVLAGGINAIGSVGTLQGTNPWITAQSGTVITSIAGILENTIQASTTGLPVFFKSNVSTSVMSVVSPATPLPVSVQGTITALQGTTPWLTNQGGSVIVVLQSSSLIAINAGSVVALSSGSVINVFQSSSLIAVVTGSVALASSVITVPTGSVITIQQANSIVGTYAEDAGHASADKGVFTLMVRNDTLSSITSNDTDYSPHVVDAVGRTIIKPFAGENATIISYVGSIVSGSVQLIQASVVGSKSYITDFWLNNTGSTTTLVTIQDGSTSILGQFIAPAGGGMVSTGINIPLKTNNSQDLAFKVAPSQSVLYLQVKGWQGQ